MADRRREQLLTDVLPPTAKVVLVEPRRMRDRAIDLLAEEDDLAKALASTWERDPDKAVPPAARRARPPARRQRRAVDDGLVARVARHARRAGVAGGARSSATAPGSSPG